MRARPPFLSIQLRCVGPLLTLVTVLMIEALALYGVQTRTLLSLLMIAVTLAAAIGGISSGLISAAFAVIYAAVFFSDPGTLWRYSQDNLAQFSSFAVSTPLISLVVGIVCRSHLASRLREFDLKAEIQEREKVETRLRANEERFRFLTDNAQDIIFRLRLRPQPAFDYMSSAVTRLLGYTPEDHYRDPLLPLKIVHPDDRVLLEAAAQSRRIHNEPLVCRYISKSGNLVWLEQRNRVTCDEKGRILAIEGIARSITKRKIIEEALRTSEERFRLAAECASEIIYEWDLKGSQVKWFGRIDRILGYHPGGFSRTREAWVDHLHPDDRERVKNAVEEHRKSGRTYYQQYRMRGRNGSWLHWSDRGIILRTADDQPNRMVGVISNITSQVVREKALRESEQKFRLLSELAPQMIWTAHADGNCDHFNQRWYDYTALSFDDSRDWGWKNTVHPQDRPEAIRRWRESLSHGFAYQVECRYRRGSDGSFRWHLVRALPLRNSDGEIERWFGTCTDIEDQKRAENFHRVFSDASRALSDSLDFDETLRSVLDLALREFGGLCAIHTLDADGHLKLKAARHPNPALERLAYRIERRFPRPAEHPTKVGQVVRQAQGEFGTFKSDETLRRESINSEHYEVLRGLQLKSYICLPLIARGTSFGALSIVSNHREYGAEDFILAEELARRYAIALDNARLYQEAQQANRTKDEFLATVSHELRTPLNVILGWLDILESDVPTPETLQQAHEAIRRNAGMQAELINDLLDISRIVSGKLQVDIRRTQFADAVRAATEALSLAARARDLHLDVDVDPRSCPILLGDANRLQQIVWNLLSNAIKFSRPGGRIEVRLAPVGSRVLLTVRDFGQGIDPAFLPYVFDRFRQEDNSKSRNYGGLGLGLAIVKQLVELHGGTVEAQSEGKNQGSLFKIWLPIPAKLPVQNHESETSGSANGIQELNSVRVLVVDDSADSLAVVRRILERKGAKVLTALSAREARPLLESLEIDVLISDIGMPGEDGYKFIRYLRSQNGPSALIPAAALTAYARPEERNEAIQAGFQRHIAKPVQPMELIRTVAELAQKCTNAEISFSTEQKSICSSTIR